MKQQIVSGVTAGMLALAVVTTAAPIPSVYAQSTSDLQAQIASLLAQVKQLQAQLGVVPSATNVVLSRNLSLGMTGSDVKSLQQFLNSDPTTLVAVSGVGSKGNESTYFGPATKAAVIKFQNKYKNEILVPAGLSQGTGYVGHSTRAQIEKLSKTTNSTGSNSNNSTNTGSNNNNPVVGDEGEITVTRGSEHTSTLELSGDFDEIYSVQIKAEDSAMTIDRMDFVFDKRPWKYLESFELYQDGEKIASLKATEDNFSTVGNEYRLRFSSIGAVVAKNEKDTFVLEAKALKNLSNDRELDTMTVYVPEKGIRAKDTTKVTTFGPDSNLPVRTFDFRDAEHDGEVTVTLDSSSPESSVLVMKDKTNTNNVTVMVAKLKAEDSNFELKEAYLKVESSESVVTNVVRKVSLVHDNDTVATESVVKNGSSPIVGKDEDGNSYNIVEANEYYVHFDDLEDIEIAEDERINLTFKAEFYKREGRYSEGTEVVFTLRAVEGENSFGEDVINGDLTTGDNRTFYLYTEGLTYKLVSSDASLQGQMNRTGAYTLTFDITAFGDDVYLPISADRQTGTSTIGSVGVEYSIINGNDETYALGIGTESMIVKGANKVSAFYKIPEGSTKTVILDMSLDNAGAVANYYRAQLEVLRFRMGATDGVEYSISTGFKDFVTKPISVKS